uniref:Uncharacterized protein n=1 Tax=Oryza punctata TaxID=4537 RepID=A0A0E0KGE8_ORYPU
MFSQASSEPRGGRNTGGDLECERTEGDENRVDRLRDRSVVDRYERKRKGRVVWDVCLQVWVMVKGPQEGNRCRYKSNR